MILRRTLKEGFVACSGWISALTGLNTNVPVGIIMILIAALFTAEAVMSLFMFKKVCVGLFSSLSNSDTKH